MKKLLKLLVVNLCVLIGLLLALDFGVILLHQSQKFYERLVRTPPEKQMDPRARLPNYKDVEWARMHWQEFPGLPTEYRSFIGWRRLPFAGETIHVDGEGIRVTPQHPLATDDSPLVVFLGGSAMWGTGASDETTIPAIFAQMAAGRYRVLNLAESGYNAYQGYQMLQLEIMKGLRPAIVVAYDGVNEKDALLAEARVYSHRRENQIRDAMKGRDRVDPAATLTFRHFLLNPLETFISIRKAKHFGSQSAAQQLMLFDLSPKRVEQVARRLLETWRATQRLCESCDSEFLAILQPNAGVGNPVRAHLALPPDQVATLDAYRVLYPEILRLLEAEEYLHLRPAVAAPLDAYDVPECVYVDYAHVSPNGNRIMARKILDRVTGLTDGVR